MFILALRIELFKNNQVWNVEVSKDLSHLSMLMPEHTALTIEAHLLIVEGPTVLGLKLVVTDLWFYMVAELIIAMGKFTLLAISTDASVHPVLAQFSLELTFRVLVVIHEAI